MDDEHVTGGIGTIQWEMKRQGYDFYRQTLADYPPEVWIFLLHIYL